MRPAEVLKRMKELKEEWSKQSFRYTSEQKSEYDRLLQLRREGFQSACQLLDSAYLNLAAAIRESAQPT